MACGCGCGFAGGGFASAAIMSSMMSHPYYGSTSTYHSYREDEQVLRPESIGYHCKKCGQPVDLVGNLDSDGFCKDCEGSQPTATHLGNGKIVHPQKDIAPVVGPSDTTPPIDPTAVGPSPARTIAQTFPNTLKSQPEKRSFLDRLLHRGD